MKRMNMLKTVAVITLLSLSLSACGRGGSGNSAGASGNGAGGSTGGAAENGESSGNEYKTTYGDKQFDNVTIKVELFDRSNAPGGTTLLDNRWVKYVNEQMNKVGIQVEFVAVPRADEVPKMQTMMSSQSAPDITLTYTYSLAEDYFNQGGTWDLSEFIDGEDQARNIKAYIGEDVLDIGRNQDNKLYGIVARRATTANTNLFIRKDWLDELNLPVPTTVDELYAALEQIVKNNPDGRKDVIGVSFYGLNDATNDAAIRNTMSLAFSKLASDPREIAISSGVDYYYDPGYRDYLKFVNKCYNNGLMDEEYYTMTTDTYNSDIVNGAMCFFESNVGYNVDVLRGSLLNTLQENDPDADLVAIPPLKNVNDGETYVTEYSAGGLIAFCPKTADAETVEACMTYLDWLCTKEGGFVIYHGFEGEHYKLNENNIPVVIDSQFNAEDKDWIRTDLFLTGNQGYFETEEDFNVCTAAENPKYSQYVLDDYKNSVAGTRISSGSYTSPSTPDLKTDIGLVRSEWIVKCVTCPESEFDSNFDKFIKAAEDAGVETIVEERKAYFDEIFAEQ
ncbi:extracellular solute-binding protein [Lachnoclostridium sp. Marseille-P6806]|uniref:extracellular solute-binding protein n=1 Tax=Lachnoclostridium sp. Marseille-P6806 TaxID=2364793 RepID=UPI00102F4B7B|nr:extracellular solute-binding protein [Lachnoclostridium sp. Marseille-P6806]